MGLRAVVGGIAVLVAAGAVGGAVYFADQLTLPPTYRPFEPDNELLDATDETVTLRDEGWAALDGTWGLQLPDDRHVVLGELVSRDAGAVTWTWTDPVGDPPRPGEPVRVDEFVWVGSPDERDVPWEDVEVAGPLGGLPAWWVETPGAVGTVVFVHGRGATREESLRFLPTLREAGWNVLVPTYRGDEGAPPWPDGRMRFGTREWEDLDAAVADVRARRPDDPLVLFGISMGGALVGQYLDRAEDTTAVAGVVLDSPLLSFDDLLVLQGGLNGVPTWANPVLLPLVQVIGDVRFDLDSGSLEQVTSDGTFDRPTLLFHGDADMFVPVGPSEDFTEQHPGTTWVRVPAAGHVRSWNVDRDGYVGALTAFLDTVDR